MGTSSTRRQRSSSTATHTSQRRPLTVYGDRTARVNQSRTVLSALGELCEQPLLRIAIVLLDRLVGAPEVTGTERVEYGVVHRSVEVAPERRVHLGR